jgi:hypothetical protein
MTTKIFTNEENFKLKNIVITFFIYIFFAGFIIFFQKNLEIDNFKEIQNIKVISILFPILYYSFFFGCLGYYFKNYRLAVICFLSHFVVIQVYNLILEQTHISIQERNWILSYLKIPLNNLFIFIFIYFQYKASFINVLKIFLIFCVISLGSYISYHSEFNSSDLSIMIMEKIFSEFIPNSISSISSIILNSAFFYSTVDFCKIYFIILFVKSHETNVNFKDYLFKPNFNLAHNKLIGFLYFIGLKSIIFRKLDSISRDFFFLFSKNSKLDDNLINSPNWFVFISLILNVILVYVLMFHLRKFLLELFVSVGQKPSWLYLACLFPYIGIFFWLVLLIRKKKEFSLIKMVETEIGAPMSITFVFLFILMCSTFFNFFNGNTNNNFSSIYYIEETNTDLFMKFSPIILGIVFFIATNSRTYYSIFLIIILISIAGIIFFEPTIQNSGNYSMYSKGINTFFFYFMLLPVFHFHSFIDYNELEIENTD